MGSHASIGKVGNEDTQVDTDATAMQCSDSVWHSTDCALSGKQLFDCQTNPMPKLDAYQQIMSMGSHVCKLQQKVSL